MEGVHHPLGSEEVKHFQLITRALDRLRPFLTIARGEWAISGFRAADLRAHLPALTPSRSSHLLKRLRLHGLIKKIGHRYKYYLTKIGRRVVATTLAIREFVVVPALCPA